MGTRADKMVLTKIILVNFILNSAVWIISVTSTPSGITSSPPKSIGGSPRTPEIDACRYVDAHTATCWWKRPQGDNETIYRLGQTSSSNHLEEVYCSYTVTHVTSDGIVVEECGFKSLIYIRFTFWVEKMIKYNDTLYPTKERSHNFSFKASSEQVLLITPPSSLNIENGSNVLTWEVPAKSGSLLIYVVEERHFFYRIEFKENVTSQKEWKQCYRGYRTEAHLPPFKAGHEYHLRVFASLDPVRPIDWTETDIRLPDKEIDMGPNREWSQPSEMYVYHVPERILSKPRGKSVPPTDEENLTLVVGLTAGIGSFVVVMAVVGCYLYWKGLCCFKVKSIKPNTLILFDEECDEEFKPETSLLNDLASNRSDATIHRVPMNEEFDWIVKDLHHETGNTYTMTISKEIKDEDLRNRILASFKEKNNYDDEISFNISNDGNDETMKKQKEKFHSRYSVEEESIQYMKLVDNNRALPTYLLTDEDQKPHSHGSNESIDTEYVMEYTAVSTAATPTGSSQTEAALPMEESEDRGIKFKELMSLQKFSKDGILPDYVMQAFVSHDDFASTISSFLHTLTESEHHSVEINMDGQEHLTVDIPPISTDQPSDHVCDNTHIHYVDTLNEYTSQMLSKVEKDELTSEPIKVLTLRRTGSGSIPSIDSGYSPDILEVSLTSSH